MKWILHSNHYPIQHLFCISISINIVKKIYICICRVGIKIRVRSVKRIFIWIRRRRYVIEEIFTGANMIITEFDK